MTEAELKAKYGDERVVCVLRCAITVDQGHDSDNPFYKKDELDFPAGELAEKLRWEVENDPSWLQIVSYGIVVDRKTHTILTTLRTGGDSRLVNKHSIGTGGHVSPGETPTAALFRELEEETAVTPDEIDAFEFLGYIFDDSSPVNSVHLGCVYVVVVKDAKFVVNNEPDKHEMQWLTAEEVNGLNLEGFLEDWSDIAFKAMMKHGG